MLRHSGQAAIEVGRVLHTVCVFLLSLTVLLSACVIGVAWRLSRGPLELDYFKDRVEAAVNKSIDPWRITIGGVAISWAGFSHGLNQPLVLRVTGVTVDEGGQVTGKRAAGAAHARIPVAEAALSFRSLLGGRILPRAITLEGARLALTRDANGSIRFDIGGPNEAAAPSPLVGLLAALGAPSQTDLQMGGDRLSQLSAVSIHDATLTLDDRLLGVTWSAERADIDLTRHSGGGVDGRATVVLVFGDQKATLEGTFNVKPLEQSAHVVAHLSRVTPKALAETAPVLAPLKALDAPLTLDAEADLGPDFLPTHLSLTARVGAGKIEIGASAIPLQSAAMVVAGTLERATLESAVIKLQPAPDGAVSTVRANGQFTHASGRLTATMHLTLDNAAFADLPVLWPEDAAPNARTWITSNVQTGTAHDGIADIEVEAADDFSGAALTKATATLEGDDVAVTWLPTVPRIEQGRAHLVVADPDRIEIDVKSGRQKVKGADPILIQSGHVTITGLTQKDQVATIRCDAAGSIPSAIALLREPRLGLLDRHPMDLRAPAGDVRMTLQAVVPLEKKLLIDDVTIHATGNLSKTHLTGIAAGRDLDDGAIAFDVDTTHLAFKGTAKLAGIPSTIDGMMDFRAGPPSQVLQKVTVNGKASSRALAAAGLDAGDVLTGDVGINAVLTEYRNGDGTVTTDADLTQAELTVAPLGWRKPIGAAAKASGRFVLSKDKLTGIDRLVIDGPSIQVRGAVTVLDGKPDTVKLDRVVLGRTNLVGTIRLPRDGPIGIDLSGPVLDIAAKLLEKPPKRDRTAPPPGPAWSMRGRFDRVLLAHDQVASQVVASAENDGTLFRVLAINGKGGSGQPFSARIGSDPVPKGVRARRLEVNVTDAGGLLHGLDVTNSIDGGALTVAGEFDDTTRNHTLSGTLEITNFRVTKAAALGKLLQAVTLYGLVDALGGPGLNFASLTAPFQYGDDTLTLHDVRAFSPSLGLTAKGTIDLAGDQLDLEGTLVPAYVFNSLLGRIPLIGKLFSAERGGGLFAMSYSLRGPANDPAVAANPLSALTPGILRGMFGIFDRAPPGQ